MEKVQGEEVNFKDFEKEAKRRKRKEWIEKKLTTTANWIKDNKEIVIALAPVAIVGVKGITKMSGNISRRRAQKAEEARRELEVWDPSEGRWLHLKKPLTRSDSLEFSEMKARGYTSAQALDILGKLKY